jgi:hypothetical protein
VASRKARRNRRRRKKLHSVSKLKRERRQLKKLGRMRLWEWLLLFGAVIIALLYIIVIMPRFWGQS